MMMKCNYVSKVQWNLLQFNLPVLNILLLSAATQSFTVLPGIKIQEGKGEQTLITIKKFLNKIGLIWGYNPCNVCVFIYFAISNPIPVWCTINLSKKNYIKTVLRRLQAHTLSDAKSPIGKIHPFSKMTVTFEPTMRFWWTSGFKKFLSTMT